MCRNENHRSETDSVVFVADFLISILPFRLYFFPSSGKKSGKFPTLTFQTSNSGQHRIFRSFFTVFFLLVSRDSFIELSKREKGCTQKFTKQPLSAPQWRASNLLQLGGEGLNLLLVGLFTLVGLNHETSSLISNSYLTLPNCYFCASAIPLKCSDWPK